MPAPVIASKRMKLVNDDDPDGSEEMPMVDLGRNQDDFQRLGRGEQAVGGISDDPPFLGLRRVAVPASGTPTDQVESNVPAAPAGCSEEHGSG